MYGFLFSYLFEAVYIFSVAVEGVIFACGNVIVNIKPPCCAICAIIVLLWASTIFLQIARPSPVPEMSL